MGEFECFIQGGGGGCAHLELNVSVFKIVDEGLDVAGYLCAAAADCAVPR